ncbi:TIGR03943 family putative permease subunit [Actinomyces trachealis]|uniref:TIGR03943 family putative permease subunit n=1 Tax=Actinomyces trachealis TaxID=2763540 RepID=UPI001892945B|nr:TIGR03943 family protein [Actinomyces trachealis]
MSEQQPQPPTVPTVSSLRRSARRNTVAATIMMVAGFVALVLVLTGRLNFYLQPYFQPLMLLTALVLIVLAMWTLVDLDQPAVLSAHAPMRPSSWLVLVPVVLAVVCAPSPLGAALMSSTAVAGGSGGTVSTTAKQSSQGRAAKLLGTNPDGTAAFSILPLGTVNPLGLDELSDRYTIGSKPQLEGRTIKVLGFASSGPDGGWRLGRFKIYCCAADAVPFQTVLTGLTQELQIDQWYEVTGVVQVSPGSEVPVLQVTKLDAVPQPETPYL